MTRSHLINTRSGVRIKQKRRKMQERIGKMRTETANLWAGHVVVRRSQPHCGDAPSSRLVAGTNLWPRHLLLFMRWLLGKQWQRPPVVKRVAVAQLCLWLVAGMMAG